MNCGKIWRQEGRGVRGRQRELLTHTDAFVPVWSGVVFTDARKVDVPSSLPTL